MVIWSAKFKPGEGIKEKGAALAVSLRTPNPLYGCQPRCSGSAVIQMNTTKEACDTEMRKTQDQFTSFHNYGSSVRSLRL